MDEGLDGPSHHSSPVPAQLFLLGMEVPWWISIAKKSSAAKQRSLKTIS